MARKKNVKKEIDKLFEQFAKLEAIRDEELKNLSIADNKLSALYHKVEGIKITHISQSHKLIKELKAVLDERRIAKRDSKLSQSVVDTLKGHVSGAKSRNGQILKQHDVVLKEIEDRAKE